MQSGGVESLEADVGGFISTTTSNEYTSSVEAQVRAANELKMRSLFPMDPTSVKVFAVSKNMTLIDLKNFAKSLGLAIRRSGRLRGLSDRITFGLTKGAMDILATRHGEVKTNLFNFGFSYRSGMFNSSKFKCFNRIIGYGDDAHTCDVPRVILQVTKMCRTWRCTRGTVRMWQGYCVYFRLPAHRLLHHAVVVPTKLGARRTYTLC